VAARTDLAVLCRIMEQPSGKPPRLSGFVHLPVKTVDLGL
jgi:hypothetical protein